MKFMVKLMIGIIGISMLFSSKTYFKASAIDNPLGVWKNTDVNSDRVYDIKDLAIVSKSYDQQSSASEWNDDLDINSDEIIDLYDLVNVAKQMEDGTVVGGNLGSNNQAVKSGDWIYYSNSYDGWKLYKIRLDGTDKIKVSDEKVNYINVIGNYIYYISGSDSFKLCSIQLDGSARRVLENNLTYSLSIVGNWIYYIEGDFLHDQDVAGKYKLCKIKLDGTSKTVIKNINLADDINVNGDYIYFSSLRNGQWELNRIKQDGTDEKILSDNKGVHYIATTENYIYYSSSNIDYAGIYKMNKKDGTIDIICKDKSAYINVSDDWVYYTNLSDGSKLYKIRQDSSEKIKLDDKVTYGLHKIGNYIYYNTFVTWTTYNLYRIQIDGTNKTLID